jgi:multiple sugar transport system ATP-binding protein
VLEELGSDSHIFFEVEAAPVTAEVLESATDGGLLPTEHALFTARLDARTSARVGAPLELAVDPARFHFFDPESGLRLETAGAPELAHAR